jgi:hypothetical protein
MMKVLMIVDDVDNDNVVVVDDRGDNEVFF